MTADPLPTQPPHAAACPNCGAPADRNFCPECGQARGRDLRLPFLPLAAEAVQETVGLESRLAGTFGRLLLHPGEVTVDYLGGRRARYTTHLRTYLVASLAFFFVSALHPERVGVVVAMPGRGSVVVVAPSRDAVLTPSAKEARDLDETERKLRARGRLGAAVASRLHALRLLPPDEARRRVGAELTQAMPRVAFFLVPLLAAMLHLAFRRSGQFYAEHLVFALHANAVSFALLLPGAIAASDWLTALGGLASTGHAVVALRRVHGTSWGATLVRALPVAVGYPLLLSLAVVGVGLVALFFG